MKRRTLLKVALGAVPIGPLRALDEPPWGGPVLDTHLHLRRTPDDCFQHMQGCGVTNAVLLTRDVDQEKAKAEMEKRPHVFARSISADPAQPGADEVFRKAIAGGAVSMGELNIISLWIHQRCAGFMT
jgi:hypothetical protein